MGTNTELMTRYWVMKLQSRVLQENWFSHAILQDEVIDASQWRPIHSVGCPRPCIGSGSCIYLCFIIGFLPLKNFIVRKLLASLSRTSPYLSGCLHKSNCSLGDVLTDLVDLGSMQHSVLLRSQFPLNQSVGHQTRYSVAGLNIQTCMTVIVV